MSEGRVRVQSVLGPIGVAAGAAVDAHAHTWIDTPADAVARGLPSLTAAEAVQRELAVFAADGGGALVDCQPPGAGRDLGRLRAHQRATGIAIVAATGFHLPAWYPDGHPLWSCPAEHAHEHFAAELATGAAGVVKAAHDGAAGDGAVRALLGAAAAAATGAAVPLVVHTERGEAVEELAELLLAAGTDPRRVLLCHLDKRPDAGLHRELAAAGFRLEYDTFVRPRYAPDEGVWPLLEAMLTSGHAGSVAVGLDLADPALWAFGGGPGPRALTREIPARLRALGAGEDEVAALCGATALDLLAVPDRELTA